MSETIHVPEIARVEGHGSLYVELNRERKSVEKVEFRIFEGSRLFEAIAVGRYYEEIPLLMSRICGICGPAHVICAVKAIENAIGIKVPENIDLLREAIACLNTIESHLIHIVVLSLPDFLNAQNITQLLPEYKEHIINILRVREVVGKGLDLLCGERVHLRNIVPGGFTGLPPRDKIRSYVRELRDCYKILLNFAESFAEKLVVEHERISHYVALHTGRDYPLTYGDLMLDNEIKIVQSAFRNYFIETVVPYSTAKKSYIHTMANYMVGALSRLNVNKDFLNSDAKDLLKKLNIRLPTTNPYLIPLAQLLECITFMEKAMDLLETTSLEPSRVKVDVRKGSGNYIIEAPRGILYHYYSVNSNGIIESADISTPTAQNVADIEDSVKNVATKLLEENADVNTIRRECEKVVRCYDPCISCSVHVTIVFK